VAKSTEYDLVLIFTAFQRCFVYSSIIKELIDRYRIGIFVIDLDRRSQLRINNTNAAFLRLCESFGAEIIRNKNVKARVEILSQSNFTEEDISHINTSISSEKTYWLLGLAMGNASYNHLYGKHIDKVLVIDRKFYDYRIENYGNDGIYFSCEKVVEVGLPYDKYPVFELENFHVDYLWANPTPFSFSCVKDILDYLQNVNFLIEKIGPDDVVAFKPHNADERLDYIINYRLYAMLSLSIFRPFDVLLDSFSKYIVVRVCEGVFQDFFYQVSIVLLYMKLMQRVVKLSELTKFDNFNLEVFMPYVRKGMITGRSNSIWHALFLKKKVFNCIDKEKVYFSQTKMHKFSMQYFNVHGNYHNLDFNEELFNMIDESTRRSNLIQFLISDLGDGDSQ